MLDLTIQLLNVYLYKLQFLLKIHFKNNEFSFLFTHVKRLYKYNEDDFFI